MKRSYLLLAVLAACGPTTGGALSPPAQQAQPPPADLRQSALLGTWSGTYQGFYGIETPVVDSQPFQGSLSVAITLTSQNELLMDLSTFSPGCRLLSTQTTASKMEARAGQTCSLFDAPSRTTTQLRLLAATGSLSAGFLDESITADFSSTSPRGTVTGLFQLNFHGSK